jgi:hypothetical protein
MTTFLTIGNFDETNLILTEFLDLDNTQQLNDDLKINYSKHGYTLINVPGLDDYLKFLKNICNNKEKLIKQTPIDAIVLIVKFDRYDYSDMFFNIAELFYSAFGSSAMKSLMILGFQANNVINDINFQFDLYNSTGYKYLYEKNMNNPIPICLCNGLMSKQDQKDSFFNCINNLEEYNQRKMIYAIELIEKESYIFKLKEKLNKIRADRILIESYLVYG